jgi:hypothetical protein
VGNGVIEDLESSLRFFQYANAGKRTPEKYDSEIHVDIGWLWDGGINLSIGNNEVTGNVRTVAEVLPWLQAAIAKHFPTSKYHVERTGGEWKPVWVDPPESRPRLSIVSKQ